MAEFLIGLVRAANLAFTLRWRQAHFRLGTTYEMLPGPGGSGAGGDGRGDLGVRFDKLNELMNGKFLNLLCHDLAPGARLVCMRSLSLSKEGEGQRCPGHDWGKGARKKRLDRENLELIHSLPRIARAE